MGSVTALVSGKGGTGKTTLCAAIASCMAAEGKRVLCLDLDIGLRNLDLLLGMGSVPVLPFSEVALGHAPLSAAAPHPAIPGLFLLTAPMRPPEAGQELLEPLLSEARGCFDEIFLDAPAGLGALFRLAVRSADRVLLVAAADPASLRDAAQTAQLLELQGTREAYLLVNRVRRGYFRSAGLTVDDIMDSVGLPLGGLVPEDRLVPLAAAHESPLVLYERRGAAAACLRISRRLSGRRVPLAIT